MNIGPVEAGDKDQHPEHDYDSAEEPNSTDDDDDQSDPGVGLGEDVAEYIEFMLNVRTSVAQ
jgi:hypothetical protein